MRAAWISSVNRRSKRVRAAAPIFSRSAASPRRSSACARPVIAGRVFGIPEVVDDGVTGVLVDPLRIDEIAHALDRLGDTALREKMGAAARTRFERLFTLEIQAARMQALYRSLVNGSVDRGAA